MLVQNSRRLILQKEVGGIISWGYSSTAGCIGRTYVRALLHPSPVRTRVLSATPNAQSFFAAFLGPFEVFGSRVLGMS